MTKRARARAISRHFAAVVLPVATVLLASVASGGCKKEEPAGPVPGGASAPIPVTSVAAAPETFPPEVYAARLCETLHALPAARRDQCCKGAGDPHGGTLCARELRRAVEAKSVTIDPVEVGRCGNAMKDALSDCDWIHPKRVPMPPDCQGIVHGALAAGARCRSTIECQEGLFCLDIGVGAPGTCGPPRKDGAACRAAANDELAEAVRVDVFDARHPECSGSCLKGRCQAPGAAGGACAGDRGCATGLVCAAGKCAKGPRGAAGDACVEGSCAHGLRCDEGKCAPLGAEGVKCKTDDDCRGSCRKLADAGEGKCGKRCTAKDD